MEHEADVATEAAKQAVEETVKTVDSWLEDRRKMEKQNEHAEDAERNHYFREREEAMKERERRVREKLEAAGVSVETIRMLLSNLPEAIE